MTRTPTGQIMCTIVLFCTWCNAMFGTNQCSGSAVAKYFMLNKHGSMAMFTFARVFLSQINQVSESQMVGMRDVSLRARIASPHADNAHTVHWPHASPYTARLPLCLRVSGLDQHAPHNPTLQHGSSPSPLYTHTASASTSLRHNPERTTHPSPPGPSHRS